MDADFIPVAQSQAVRLSRITQVEVDNQSILLTRLTDELCAFNALCPHQLGNLSRGFIYREEIECPVHGWRFNLRTGKSVYPQEAGLCLRRYPVTEENGLIKIKFSR